jgi:hypothetical protein
MRGNMNVKFNKTCKLTLKSLRANEYIILKLILADILTNCVLDTSA